MAQMLKGLHSKNYSPGFADVWNYFSRSLRINRIYMILALLGLILAVVLVAFNKALVGWTCIISLLLFFNRLFRIHKELNSLISYPESCIQSFDRTKLVGDEGEIHFIEVIQKVIEDDGFKILNNLYLPDNRDDLNQVDSVIIGPSGNIYAIEVKKWPGLISGKIEDNEWLTPNGFQESPYKQNERQIETIKKELYTGLDLKIEIYNLIINVGEDSYFNVCKYDKIDKNIYDDPQKLLEWIIQNEQHFIPNLAKQRKIINKLWNIHYCSLHEFETRLNERILKKFDVFENFVNNPYCEFEGCPEIN